jgi:TolA-binding protein
MKIVALAILMMALLAGTAAARNQPNTDARTEAFMKTYNQAANDAVRRFEEFVKRNPRHQTETKMQELQGEIDHTESKMHRMESEMNRMKQQRGNR